MNLIKLCISIDNLDNNYKIKQVQGMSSQFSDPIFQVPFIIAAQKAVIDINI